MNTNKIRIENNKDNLVIRSAELKDAEILNAWWNDGKVMAHAGFPNGLNQSVKETEAQILQNENRLSQRCIIELVPNSIETNLLKGNLTEEDSVKRILIGEMSFNIGDNYAEIGIKICEVAYQNKGLGTKLIQMFIDFLFSDENINGKHFIEKIILDTNLNNLRAQHVYEKLGFKKLRVNHNAWKDQLGVWQSSVDYELTRECYEDGIRWITDSEQKQ